MQQDQLVAAFAGSPMRFSVGSARFTIPRMLNNYPIVKQKLGQAISVRTTTMSVSVYYHAQLRSIFFLFFFSFFFFLGSR